MELLQWINHDIHCSCGRTHRCDIGCVDIGADALSRLPEHIAGYHHILLVADSNTYTLCGERVRAMLINRSQIEAYSKNASAKFPSDIIGTI